MEIKIEVSDEMFSEVCEKELKALSPEDVKDVIIQCIGEYFRNNNYANTEKLVVSRKNNAWSFCDTYEATEFTNRLVKALDYSALQDVLDASIETLKNKHEDLIKNILLEAMIRGISNTYGFRSVIEEAITEHLYSHRQ